MPGKIELVGVISIKHYNVVRFFISPTRYVESMIISHFFTVFTRFPRQLMIYLICLGIFVAGCDSNSDDMDMDPPVEDGKIRSIALEPGSKRTYNWSLTITARDFEGNILNELVESDVLVAEVMQNARPLEGISDPIEVRYYRSASPDTFSVNWYVQDDAGLTEVAFENPGILPRTTLKRGDQGPQGLRLAMLAGPGSNDVLSIDPVLREDPRIVFPYPMDVGDTWVSFSEPFLQTREVVLRDTVQVADDIFEVLHVTTESDVSGFDGWTDLISSTGLIERVSSTETPLRDALGTPVGTQTTEERLSLVRVEAP